jgi:acyl dehydratase
MMMKAQIYFEDVKEGSQLPALMKGPIERIQLVKYAGASGDFNPIHVDEEYARSAGMKSVFAHGMLSMGFMGQLITDWLGEEGELLRFKVRFKAIVWPGDVITNTGTIVKKYEDEGKGLVEIELSGKRQDGQGTVAGSATASLPFRGS